MENQPEMLIFPIFSSSWSKAFRCVTKITYDYHACASFKF